MGSSAAASSQLVLAEHQPSASLVFIAAVDQQP
jgi:hypothetical protein